MSVKFKIGFDIDAQTLFAMIAKFMPVDNVTVEEIMPAPPAPTHQPTRVLAQQLVRHLDKPTRKKYVKRQPARPMDLTKGINRIIIEALSHGMGRSAIDLKPLLKKGGYSVNSVGSRLNSLRDNGVVEQLGGGVWRLTDQYALPQIAMNEAGAE